MSGSLFDLPSREYSAFIFDCDGTLADSMPLHQRAWVAALRKYGATFDFGWELFMSRAGKSIELTVAELNAEFGTALDPALVSAAQRAEYDVLALGVKPIDEVVAYARARAQAGCPVSVASGGDAPTVARTLRTIGVSDLFPIVVTVEDVEHGKPAPDLFLLAAKRMGVAPAECLVFEDSLLGIMAAERAGMGAVLVASRDPASADP
ncbi:MAG TPA: HAD family phosphatase [Polyangiaceae bacterium]|nr:HAD family phosphatase [Polyangiaceae bacterium]